MNARGDWIQTALGGQFWPIDPRSSEIEPQDVAHALSLQCRRKRLTNALEAHIFRFEKSPRRSELSPDGVRSTGFPWIGRWGAIFLSKLPHIVDFRP
jgi:hypothetical protein